MVKKLYLYGKPLPIKSKKKKLSRQYLGWLAEQIEKEKANEKSN